MCARVVMGALEDTRKVLQDFLAPELRAISVRLDPLDGTMTSDGRKNATTR